jgi:regulatory protein
MEKSTNTITAIKAGQNPRIQRSNIYLNGRFAFSLDNEVIFREKLQVGQSLSAPQLEKLNGSDERLRCLNAALQFLTVRPRSRTEIVERLNKRGFGEAEIESTLLKLKDLNLLDDAAFAEYWKENRTAFRPRSQRMVGLELRRKGIESEIVKAAVSGIDETANAYQAALTRSRSLSAADYPTFRKKLGGFLQRRGFGYAVINTTLKRVWLEKNGESAAPVDLEEETGTAQE